MKYYIVVLFLFFLSCNDNKEITIRVSIDNTIQETTVDKDITELVFRIGQFTTQNDIEGISKLKRLRKLNIQMGGNYSDYSFLTQLRELEILIMISCSIDNLNFLRNMDNLRILILSNSIIYKNEINLQNNKNLKYLDITGLYFYNKDAFNSSITSMPPYVPNIINIPDSLEYLNIDRSLGIILSTELLTNLTKTPHVILGRMDIEYHKREIKKNNKFNEVHKSYTDNWDYIQSHPNFILKDPEEMLPIEYQAETLLQDYLEKDISTNLKIVDESDKNTQ